jgi:hypothetical protein
MVRRSPASTSPGEDLQSLTLKRYVRGVAALRPVSVVVVNLVTIAAPVDLAGQRQNEQIAAVAVDLCRSEGWGWVQGPIRHSEEQPRTGVEHMTNAVRFPGTSGPCSRPWTSHMSRASVALDDIAYVSDPGHAESVYQKLSEPTDAPAL